MSTMELKHLFSPNYAGRVIVIVFLCLTRVQWVLSEAFTSTANLLHLVQSEDSLLPLLEAYVKDEEAKLKELSSFIADVKARPLYEQKLSGGLFYAGHPVNSYNLIKRWYKMSQMSQPSSALTELHKKLRSMPVPTEEDFEGANAAILRLQRVFQLNTSSILSGHVYGYQSAQKMEDEDSLKLGEVALKTFDYGLAIQWFKVAESKFTDRDSLKKIYQGLIEACEQIDEMICATDYAEKALEMDLSDAQSRDNYERLKQALAARGEGYVPKFNETMWRRPIADWRVNYERLCRGEADATSDPAYTKDLICFYKPGKIPYVQYKHEVLSWEPRIGMFYDVISDKDANTVIAKAYPQLTRGLVGDPKNPATSTERISKLTWLWDNDPFIKFLSERVSDATGLETKYNQYFSCSEPFQVVNYGMGGQYEPHVDYYEDSTMLDNVPEFIRGTGDRISTFLFYLSDVPVGGSTVYPRVNIRVSPVKNAAAFWYNSKLSGELDKRTEHAGCPVLIGQKWVTNKWIRERCQEFTRPCALSPDAIDYSIK